jgi:CPA1 family monovalent cation:H+ antiporter
MVAESLAAELVDVLAVFIIAGAVGAFVAKVARVPYTIALLLAGIVASVAGFEVGIQLTHDVILLLLLPPLLFEGAATTDLEAFRRDLPAVLVLATVGLLVSVLAVGYAVHAALGFPLLLGLLFAVMAMPTDPVSVLALFEEIGAPERLSVLVEGESLLNDGVAVVVFGTLLALVRSGATPAALASPLRLAAVGADIAVASLGGAAVGLLAGYVVYRVMRNLDEHMTETVLTIVLAYGAFLLAEHYLHVSGVIATVVAGLFVGNRGREYAMSAQTTITVFNTWATGAFIVNTFIFLVIGAQTPVRELLSFADLILPAIALVLLGRALAVYPLSTLANRVFESTVGLDYQHVLVWGGLHASIPIALVLGLPPAFPLRSEMRAMVFGIAAFSLVVQGLTVRRLVDGLGIATVSDEERLYQLLLGRARAVDAVLEAADDLYADNRLPTDVYERFTAEYESEKADLRAAISQLLSDHPSLRDREQVAGERMLLRRERAAIRDAELDGLVPTDVADELLEEVNLKLDRVERGETTVLERGEGYEEYWRERAREKGLLTDESETAGDDPSGEAPDE